MKSGKAKAAVKEPPKGGNAKATVREPKKGGNAKAAARKPAKGIGAGRPEWDGEGEGTEGEEPKSDEGSAGTAGLGESGRRIMELLEKEQTLGAPGAAGRASARARSEKFRFLDHTADVGIQAYGETLCEAFENAALGMFNIITDPSKVGAQKDFEVTIEGADLKNLLHEWLDQLLILSQVNNMLFSSFKVDLKDLENGVLLTGLVMGEPADPSKHVYKTEIKAVTHHMLEVNEDPPMVKVLFDI